VFKLRAETGIQSVFPLVCSAMGWFMPPFRKIQTPWTEQEGKAYLTLTKADVPKLNLAFFCAAFLQLIICGIRTRSWRKASDPLRVTFSVMTVKRCYVG